MAELVGVTRQSILYWETGRRRPTGDRLVRYIKALDACRGRK